MVPLIDEGEFMKIQGVYFNTLQNLSATDRKLKKVEEDQFQKNITNELQNVKKLMGNSSS